MTVALARVVLQRQMEVASRSSSKRLAQRFPASHGNREVMADD